MNSSEAAWCPATLLHNSQINNYYNQRVLDQAIEKNWTLPNAIYLDAMTYGGAMRTGSKALSTPSAQPACHIFKYTKCLSKDDAEKGGVCDAGYVLDTDDRAGFPATYEHFDAYDSYGEKHSFCLLPNENHWKCCKLSSNPTKEEDAAFAYAGTLILYNIMRSCSSGRDSASKATCEQFTAQWREKRALSPSSVG